MWKKLSLNHVAIVVFVLALAVRLGNDITQPPYDAHPMRQTDTACVIHFFYSGVSSPLEPRACLSRPPTNTEGYFFLEFPLYQWLVAVVQKALMTEAWWTARLVNFALFSLAFWSLYYGTRRAFGSLQAVFAIFIFSWLPSGLFFFGQAIHPDVLMIALLFTSWNLLSYVTTKQGARFWWLYLLSMTLLIATRPFAALAIAPFSYFLWINKRKLLAIANLFVPLSLYGAWRGWQLRYPEADHAWQNWVLTGQDELKKVAVLRNLIWKNVVGEVVGKASTLLAGFGLLSLVINKHWRWLGFFTLYLLMIPIYWYVVPAGNLAHQYYAHVFLLPMILLAALALNWIATGKRFTVFRYGLVAALLLLVVLNGYRTSRYFFLPRTSADEIAMASFIQATVPEGEMVLYLGQSSLPMSLAFRQGWNTAQPPADVHQNAQAVLDQLRFAPYLIVPNFDDSFPQAEKQAIQEQVELVAESDLGSIFRLANQQ